MWLVGYAQSAVFCLRHVLHTVLSNQVLSDGQNQVLTMNATKPQFLPFLRCSSSRGHMILTLPMGPNLCDPIQH